MNETEKFLFDINGYIVVRNALTPQQVHDLKEKLNLRLNAKSHYSWKNKNDVKDAPNDPVIKDRILHFGSDRAWPKKDELMAANLTIKEMAKKLKLDSLHFLSLRGLYKSMGLDNRNDINPQFTDHCFSGDYPTELTDK